MIIGIDASRANEEKKTGVGWYAYYIIEHFKHLSATALEHNRQPVRVVLYSRESLKGELANLPVNWESKVLKWLPGRLWTQFRLSLEMLFHTPDVLFIPAHVFPIIRPKKTVMTLHDIAAIKFPEAYSWFEKWYTLWSGKIALKKLWKVITISQFTKNELKNEFGDKNLEKVKVVYLGYNKEYERDIQDTKILEILKKYNIEKPYLLSIGRLEEKKNTVRIIKAFEKIKNNFKLVLVGSGGYGYEKVKQVIENSPFKKDIITTGYVSDEDLPALMHGAEMFLFPSLYEGFGIPILEALASGTPVVASAGGASQEVGGNACGYVDPFNIDSIVAGVLNMVENEDFKLQNVKMGKERVKNFSWKKCAEETWHILNYD